MIKVRFEVGFNSKGEVVIISRSCDIPTPSCQQCKFKEWCDKVESLILEKGGNNDENNG